MTAAYISAQLTHANPKKFPKLEDIIGNDEAKTRRRSQSDEQIKANFMRFAIKHGLEVDG